MLLWLRNSSEVVVTKLSGVEECVEGFSALWRVVLLHFSNDAASSVAKDVCAYLRIYIQFTTSSLNPLGLPLYFNV